MTSIRRIWAWFRERRSRQIVGAALALLLLGGGAVHYSESPAFCHSCHIMEPYYQAWKTSKHNHVACVECHYPPGAPQTLLWKKFQALSQVAKYVTRTYSSKPFAEIENTSCLRSGCHATRLLEGKLVTKRGINFDHRPHLTEPRRGRQLRCVSCHSQIVVGRHVEVTYDTCYLCHFKGMGEGRNLKPVGGCLGCHRLPEKTFRVGNMSYNHRDFVTTRKLSCQNCHMDIVRGKGEATQDRCFTCHNQPEKLARFGDIPFIHENHVTKHNVACFHCHREIRHSLGEAGSGDAEAAAAGTPGVPPAAHVPALTFDCSFCHEDKHGGQLEMYSGKVAALGLPEIPSPMYTAEVDCAGCHYRQKSESDPEFRGITYRASEQACVKCHGTRFAGIWEETKAELTGCLGRLDEKLAQTKAALAKASLAPAARRELERAVGRAERWHHFVRAARGEHNIYLASAALRREDAALSAAGETLKAALSDLSQDPLISGRFCATLCHTKVGVKVPPETVRVGGKTMPHRAHAELLRCVDCHELGGHKRVPLKEGVKAVCAGCHPE